MQFDFGRVASDWHIPTLDCVARLSLNKGKRLQAASPRCFTECSAPITVVPVKEYFGSENHASILHLMSVRRAGGLGVGRV